MNHKEQHPFSNLDLPKVRQNQEYKKRLRAALLLAHQERSRFSVFGHAINDVLRTMSKPQKSFALGALALAIAIGVAGVFGPSAYSVANAQAKETINRAFTRLANLSDEERAELQEKFQGRMLFKHDAAGHFTALKDISPEELEARHEQMKASLTETLAEAQAAPDLQIVSADELPVSGFFGRAGRAIGFKMMHKPADFEEKLASLPEDVRLKIEEFRNLHEEMRPVSFMVYTNADGQTVYIGINENDEPVVKFVKSKDGELPFPPHGKRMLFRSENGKKPQAQQ